MTEPTAAPRRGPLKILGIVVLGLVGAVAAAAAVIGLGFLFWLLAREVFVAIGRAIVDAVKNGGS